MATNNVQINISANDQASSQFERLRQSFTQINGEVERVSSRFTQLNSTLSALGGALSLGAVAGLTKALVDAGLQMEKLTKLFTAAAGSANLGGREMEYVREIANRLGLELTTTAEAYGKWMAAIRSTSLEGEKGRQVFESVAKASTALGLSADETKGIFTALGQMMSKGKVQAEELRGQLGERLPGAFKMAADAMGITTAELDKQLKDGRVMADDLLPKLAVELEKVYGGAAAEGAKSAGAEINRFNTALFETKSALGQQMLPAITELLQGVRPMLSIFKDITAEFYRLGMLVDKAGGSLTAFGMIAAKVLELTTRFATAGQFGDTFKNAAEWFSEKNKMYEARYNASDKKLQELAFGELGLDSAGNRIGSNYTAAEKARQAANPKSRGLAGAAAADKKNYTESGGAGFMGWRAEQEYLKQETEYIKQYEKDLKEQQKELGKLATEMQTVSELTASIFGLSTYQQGELKFSTGGQKLSLMGGGGGYSPQVGNSGPTLSQRWSDQWKIIVADMTDAGRQIEELAGEIASNMSGAFSTMFFDTMMGKFQGFGSYLKNFFNNLMGSISNIIGQQLTGALSSALSGGSGGGGGFFGSLMNGLFSTGSMAVTASTGVPMGTGGLSLLGSGGGLTVPAFDVGTAFVPYDMLAMVHRGEKIVPASQNTPGAGGGVNITVAVENKSNATLKASQSQTRFNGRDYVVGVILQDVAENGPLRGLMAGGM